MPDQSDAIRWATEPSARCRPNQHRGRREAALELSAPETARDIGISSAAEHCGQPVDASLPNEDGTGDVVFYAAGRGPGHVVGASYRARVDRHDHGATMHGAPQFHRSQVAGAELRVEWAERDLATRARLAAQRRERAVARHNDLDELIEPLRQVAAKLRTGADRDALVAHILRRLISTW